MTRSAREKYLLQLMPLLVPFLIGIALSCFGEKAEFDMSLGSVRAVFEQQPPIEVRVKGGEDGYVEINYDNFKYQNKSFLASSGKFNLKNSAYHKGVLIEASMEGGVFSTETESGGKTYNATLFGCVRDIYGAEHIEGESSTAEIATIVYTPKATSGKLILNYRAQKPNLPSSEQLLARKLGLSIEEAKKIVKKFGAIRSTSALQKALRNAKRHYYQMEAGGAGSIEGSDQMDLGRSSASDVFQFYLHGPEFKGMIIDSGLFMELYHPQKGKLIKDMSPTITVVKPKKTGGGDIVLIDEMNYHPGFNMHHMDFKRAKWLTGLRQLAAGPYLIHVDIGSSEHLELPIRLTADKRVIPR